MLLLRCAGKIWGHGMRGRRAVRRGFRSLYRSGGDIRTVVTVRVPPKGMWKEIELELTNEGEDGRGAGSLLYRAGAWRGPPFRPAYQGQMGRAADCCCVSRSAG